MKKYLVVKTFVLCGATHLIQEVDNKQDAIDFADILIKNETNQNVKYAVYEQLIAED